ncbi:unnamed protein product [Adineta steineri]|uniref:Uncharacterized protein n=1 Tax=Adineta steineri TaxID=433720 RepID=A0A814T765_9BILA|nr:unnamed protein product [Adineta steineri]CAF1349683.1 unnamed protein product [Adineta steineri]
MNVPSITGNPINYIVKQVLINKCQLNSNSTSKTIDTNINDQLSVGADIEILSGFIESSITIDNKSFTDISDSLYSQKDINHTVASVATGAPLEEVFKCRLPEQYHFNAANNYSHPIPSNVHPHSYREQAPVTSSQPRENLVRYNYHEDNEGLINRQINTKLYASYVCTTMVYHFDRCVGALEGEKK